MFSGAIGLLLLSPSFYMLEVYGRVVNSRSGTTLLMLTLLLALAYAVLEGLQWARQGALRHAAEGLDRRLSERAYAASFRERETEARTRGLEDLSVLREFLGGPFFSGLLDIPMGLFLLGMIFWIDGALGWFAALSAALQGLLAYLSQKAAGESLFRAGRAGREAREFVRGALRRQEAVRALGMAEGLRRRWEGLHTETLKHQTLAAEYAGAYASLSRAAQIVSGSLILGLGSWLMLTGEFSRDAGWMLMASILAGRSLAPITQAIAGWRKIAEARDAWGRVREFLARDSEPAAGMSLPPPKGNLAAEQMTVCVPGGEKPVLRDISFTLPPGSILAIIGPSAAGKSVLLRALSGAWPCRSGAARLDGAELSAWDKRELGPHIGFLPQNVGLFAGTVAENISRFGAPEAEKIEEAAELVHLREMILSLPRGYDTEIGAEGAALSGGVRQRLGLARALYGNPKLILLDEPDASLDTEGADALARALRIMRGRGAAIVLVTHRKRLLSIADKILALANGRIMRFGSREEVTSALFPAAAAAAAQRS